MALFKPMKGNRTNLPSTMTEGWAYFCTDTGEFFIDYADDNGVLHRKQINADEANKIAGLTGGTNQIVSFDENGNLIAQDHENGMMLKNLSASMPEVLNWKSITYGNGKFVAVGCSSSDASTNIAAYSEDGISWTKATMPTSGMWKSVTYGGGKFVALAHHSNKVVHSTDGITWTSATMPSSSTWISVTYGNGKFVAVTDSSSNKAAYSTDGATWTGKTLPRSANWKSVTYGNGKFVAVATGTDYAAYSTDGMTWSTSIMPASGAWYSVTYGDGKFVSVSNNSTDAAYSTDGQTWHSANMPSSKFWYSVAYGNGMFVTPVNYGSSSSKYAVAYSTDGINWNETTMPKNMSWNSTAFGNGKFVTIANNGSAVAYSTDGMTWQSDVTAIMQDDVDIANQVMIALNAVTEAYVDEKIAAIPTPDVSGQIDAHNTAPDAHSDIRDLISDLTAEDVGAAKSDHNHDDKYDPKNAASSALQTAKEYTNTEVAKKADKEHNHNELYYTESEIDTKLAAKADSDHNHDAKYDAIGASDTALASAKDYADAKLEEAKTYTNTKTSGLASTSSVNTSISTHNTSSTAHSDIRELITNLTTRLNALANSTDEDLDQMAEIVAYIKSNKSLIDSITTSKINVSDIVDNLTTSSTSKVLSAKQGVTIKALIDALQTELDEHTHAIADVTGLQSALDGKAASSHGTHVTYSTTAPVMDGTASVGTATTVARSDHKHPTDTSRASKTEFDSHNSDTTKHITSTERTNWGTAYTHSTSAHAPSNAQPNQNAFSNVKVGSTTVSADTTTDTIEFVGSNVTITPDATNDKVTFTVADGTTSAKGVVQLTNSTSSTSTTTAATPSSVKSAYDRASTAITNAATAQTKADSAYTLAESKVDSLSDLGITATATELNYVDGVTSNIQTQLDGKASSSHGTHVSYGTSATAVGATASAGSASTVSRSDHTHSLSKSAVTTALGYTPPTTDTVYTHPTTAGNKHIPSGGSSGQILKWSASGTAVWGTIDALTESDIDSYQFITTADIDTICGTTILLTSEVEF